MTLTRSGLVLTTAAVTAVLGITPAVGATTAASTKPVKAIGNCVSPKVAPQHYVLTCADAGLQITHAHYSTVKGQSWGDALVDATGTYVYNDCTPDCAAGHIHHHPVTFELYRIRTVAGHRLYTRLSASYAGLTETFDLPTQRV